MRYSAEIPQEIELLDCNCSICSKTGFLHLIVPHDAFTLEAGEETLTSYRFGTGAANHLFCSTCGVKSFYQPRSHPECYSLNFHCLDEREGFSTTLVPFDGKNWEEASTRS